MPRTLTLTLTLTLTPNPNSFDFYDDKLCLDSFKIDTVLGRHA